MVFGGRAIWCQKTDCEGQWWLRVDLQDRLRAEAQPYQRGAPPRALAQSARKLLTDLCGSSRAFFFPPTPTHRNFANFIETLKI